MAADHKREDGEAAGAAIVRIARPNGGHLIGRLWRPSGTGPCSAVLEATPYRTFDLTRQGDNACGTALASSGIALLRLDLGGTGESDGVITDEYQPQEQAEIDAAIAWLRGQGWCDGQVGMRGHSWGGFAALQAQGRSHNQLSGIVVHCASRNRFSGDAHFPGEMLAVAQLQWGLLFKCFAALPPQPRGEGWRDRWLERLNGQGSPIAEWLAHQRIGSFWTACFAGHGKGVTCPVFATSGWCDPYADEMISLFANAPDGSRLLVGPWGHTTPDAPEVGPALDWFAEEGEWWRIVFQRAAPVKKRSARLFLLEATLDETFPENAKGSWIELGESSSRRLSLAPDGALPGGQSGAASLEIPQGVVGAGKRYWLPGRDLGNTIAKDQQQDDAASLCFEGPASAGLTLVGAPELTLRLNEPASAGAIFARLSVVRLDGRAHLISWGCCNLARRTAQPPNEVTMPMSSIAFRFREGDRLRLALSQSLWPMFWPMASASLSVDSRCSWLELPVQAATRPVALPPATDREAAISGDPGFGREPRMSREFARAGLSHQEVVRFVRPVIDPPGVQISREEDWLYQIDSEPIHAASLMGAARFRFDWNGLMLEVEAGLRLEGGPSTFNLVENLCAREDGRIVFQRFFERSVPRDTL